MRLTHHGEHDLRRTRARTQPQASAIAVSPPPERAAWKADSAAAVHVETRVRMHTCASKLRVLRLMRLSTVGESLGTGSWFNAKLCTLKSSPPRTPRRRRTPRPAVSTNPSANGNAASGVGTCLTCLVEALCRQNLADRVPCRLAVACTSCVAGFFRGADAASPQPSYAGEQPHTDNFLPLRFSHSVLGTSEFAGISCQNVVTFWRNIVSRTVLRDIKIPVNFLL